MDLRGRTCADGQWQVWVWCDEMKAGEDKKVCESSVLPGSGAVSLRKHGFLLWCPKRNLPGNLPKKTDV